MPPDLEKPIASAAPDGHAAWRWIAWRFMMRGTERGGFSAMTLFSWMAIGVGVGTMCALLSVMYGLESSLKQSVLKAYPHLILKHRAGRPISKYAAWTSRLSEVRGVDRASPYLESELIAQGPDRTLGCVVWGTTAQELKRLGTDVTMGKLPSLEGSLPHVLLGTELAHHLDVGVHSKIRFVSPLKRGGALGLVPSTQTFEVSGFFSTGHYEFDKQYAVGMLEDLQDMVGSGDAITGWQIWTRDANDADSVKLKIRELLPPDWQVESWTDFNSALFQSLKLEQWAMFFVLSFAIAIAVMNVAITLSMQVSHKQKNIGILASLGATRNQIQRLFLWQGVFLGGVGLALGAVIASGALIYIYKFYQFPDIYYVRSAPVEIRPLSIALIFAVAVLLILAATLYPTRRATKIDPIEAIRE